MSRTSTAPEPSERPRYEAHFELTSLMCQQAATQLSPRGTTNPAYLVVFALLIILVAYGLWCEQSGIEANVPIMLVMVLCIAGLIYVAQHWSERIRRQLAREGLDPSAMGMESIDVDVEVFDDRLDVRSAVGERSYPLSTLRKVVATDRLICASFADGTVLIPRKGLSKSRFDKLGTELSSRASGGRRHA